MSLVCWSPSTRPRDVIISQTYRPAPCSAQRRRYAALVMPAIGASTTGVSTVTDPRVSEVGRAVTCSSSPALLVRLLRLGRLLDLADPGDRVELRGRPEGHGRQLAVRRHQVDQTGGRRVTSREGGR